MKFNTGSHKDNDYEKEYKGNLEQSVRDKSREFSEIIFKTYKTGFGKKAQSIASVKQELQELNDVFTQSGNSLNDYIEYLEFLIKHKGNWEFMIPYYEICHRENHEIDSFIEAHHETHHFGLLGTVDEILS